MSRQSGPSTWATLALCSGTSEVRRSCSLCGTKWVDSTDMLLGTVVIKWLTSSCMGFYFLSLSETALFMTNRASTLFSYFLKKVNKTKDIDIYFLWLNNFLLLNPVLKRSSFSTTQSPTGSSMSSTQQMKSASQSQKRPSVRMHFACSLRIKVTLLQQRAHKDVRSHCASRWLAHTSYENNPQRLATHPSSVEVIVSTYHWLDKQVRSVVLCFVSDSQT